MLLHTTFKKKKLYWEGYNLYPLKEKEYYVPEPPEEDEDPQWVDTGAEYPSDVIGDGLDSRGSFSCSYQRALS